MKKEPAAENKESLVKKTAQVILRKGGFLEENHELRRDTFLSNELVKNYELFQVVQRFSRGNDGLLGFLILL